MCNIYTHNFYTYIQLCMYIFIHTHKFLLNIFPMLPKVLHTCNLMTPQHYAEIINYSIIGYLILIFFGTTNNVV